MNHDYIVDHDVIGRYRRGALGQDEAEAFEVHLIECDGCQSLLAADARLERGLRAHAVSAATGTPRTTASRRRRAGLGLAVAAALATLVIAPWFLRPSPETSPAAQAGLPTFQLALERGPKSEAIELRVPARIAWYALELEAPVAAERCCRVVIEDSDGSVVWEGETQVAPDTGMIRVVLSRSFLHTGSYRIVLYASEARLVRLVEHQVLVQLDR